MQICVFVYYYNHPWFIKNYDTSNKYHFIIKHLSNKIKYTFNNNMRENIILERVIIKQTTLHTQHNSNLILQKVHAYME